MIIKKLLLSAAIALAFATPSRSAESNAELAKAREELHQARQELREASRKIAEISAKMGENAAPRAYAIKYLTDKNRAMIGVVLGADNQGVRLNAVTPGGPAEKAGLKPGDMLLAINGKPVSFSHHDRNTDDFAVNTLVRGLMADTKPGDTVKIAIDRNGAKQDFSVVAERRVAQNWPVIAEVLDGLKNLPDFGELDVDIDVIVDDDEHVRKHVQKRVIHDAIRAGEHARHAAKKFIILGDRGLNLRLAPLNQELGKYFGTPEGILVLNSDGDALRELKAGDVLISINNAKLEGVRDTMKALVEPEKGTPLRVELMRDRARQTIMINAPGGDDLSMLLPPPPIAPAAPAPAAKGAIPAALPAPPAPPSTPRAARKPMAAI